MINQTLQVRLGKFCEVKQIDNITYDLKLDNRKMRILINPSQNKKAKYILSENDKNQYFKKITEIVNYLNPPDDDVDVEFKIFINSEMKVLAHVSKLTNSHKIYCYNPRQVGELCDRIQKQGKWIPEWKYDKVDKVYIIECRRGENVPSM